MLFNSVIFIVLFLPMALAGWFLLQKLENPAYAKAFLVGMSLWFYGYYNVSYLWILLASLGLNYGISLLLGGCQGIRGRRILLGAGLLGNLGLLFYFKYFNFFVDNCNFFLHAGIELEKIALPLGISFFTFQQISFLVERYRGSALHYPILDYAFFISFFPQLVAGASRAMEGRLCSMTSFCLSCRKGRIDIFQPRVFMTDLLCLSWDWLRKCCWRTLWRCW